MVQSHCVSAEKKTVATDFVLTIGSDTFLLCRIDGLLDQLGNAKYFSTLDLVGRYWQIQMYLDSQ